MFYITVMFDLSASTLGWESATILESSPWLTCSWGSWLMGVMWGT